MAFLVTTIYIAYQNSLPSGSLLWSKSQKSVIVSLWEQSADPWIPLLNGTPQTQTHHISHPGLYVAIIFLQWVNLKLQNQARLSSVSLYVKCQNDWVSEIDDTD